MATEAEERKGLWERLFDSWVVFFFLVLIVGPLFHDWLGIWWGTAAYLVVLIVVGPFLWRARNRQRRDRLGRAAAATGTLEGWLRYPNALPNSLRRQWACGTFRLDGHTLVFQMLTEPDGPELGRPSTYSGLSHLGLRDVPTREAGVPRSWPVVALSTDKGEIEARVPPEGVALLESVPPARDDGSVSG